MYAIKKTTQAIGETPAKRLNQQAGIPQTDLQNIHDIANEYRREPQKLKDKYTKPKKLKIDELDKKIEKLDEKITTYQAEVAKPNDPAEKAKFLQLIKEAKESKGQLVDQREKFKEEVKTTETAIEDIFGSLPDPRNTTPTVYNQTAQSLDWSSKKNWLLIGGGFIILIIVIGFLKKLLDNLLKATK